MRKIKKIIDFEIVTILTILILISTFYFAIRFSEAQEDYSIKENFNILEYQIELEFNKKTNEIQKNEMFDLQVKDFENQLIYISNSDFDIIAIITGIITIEVNIIAIVIYFIISLMKHINISGYKKLLTEEDFIEDIKLPQYNIFFANTLYTGRISFYKNFNFLKSYFLEKNMIDKKGKIISGVNINNLNELEKEFIVLCENDVKDEVIKEFKDKIRKEFENKKYLKTNKFRTYIDYIGNKLEEIGMLIVDKNKDDTTRVLLETLLPFAILLFIAIFKSFSIILIILITYIQLKYYNLFLTDDGKKERAKLILLLETLKRKEELTEKEKFLYDALKYRDL